MRLGRGAAAPAQNHDPKDRRHNQENNQTLKPNKLGNVRRAQCRNGSPFSCTASLTRETPHQQQAPRQKNWFYKQSVLSSFWRACQLGFRKRLENEIERAFSCSVDREIQSRIAASKVDERSGQLKQGI
jgi:hypothetical protein